MQCQTPITLRTKEANNTVPCGKCPFCTGKRVSQWTVRLQQESKVSSSALFVTLTYNTDTVPLTKNGFKTLDKTDLQKFFKRLRKLNSQRIKYYAVGEYGHERGRPHYHIILFNATYQTIEQAWTYKIKHKDKTEQPKSMGEIHYGTVNEATIGYTLKYISKGQIKKKHYRDDRAMQFSVMSKGLGINYLSNEMVRWHKKDLLNRMYIHILGGQKVSMPRYYKDKIYDWQERQELKYHFQDQFEIKEKRFQAKKNYHSLHRNRQQSIYQKFQRHNFVNSKISSNAIS